ncbi:glycoside hydrolase family 3 N-terminal domain-containing protein [Robiginitalea sp.]|uniref:glycoside hydrolase family 3 N-terminal domain-containing protein n=1 Tax=Robiginitalea sp. TaxID=1902411 RepID=UPI003C70D379
MNFISIMGGFKRFAVIVVVLFLGGRGTAQSGPLITSDTTAQQQWVQFAYSQMSPEAKVGQLFMVMLSSDPAQETSELEKAQKWISDYGIGGLIFSKGTPQVQARLTNALQKGSEVPLLIGMDAEWGLAMRLDSTYAFPWNMTLGAIQDSMLLQDIGHQIGMQLRHMGVHLNFAPVVDINTNPQNPIIGNRSFGESPAAVAGHALAVMKGMQGAGILTTAKHFPGHGDTAVDSHKALPQVLFDRKRLDSVELEPFRRLISQGLDAVMIAHLDVPALTGVPGEPTSLSPKLLRDVLRKEMGFQGLICTDALNMKGVTGYQGVGNASLGAFLAGNDLLLMPENLESDYRAVLEAYRNGKISEARMATSVKKILNAKYKAGLHQYTPVETGKLSQSLNSGQTELLGERAMEQAITVLKNRADLIGIKNLDNKKIAYVKFGTENHLPFLDHLRKYAEIDEVMANDIGTLNRKLKDYNLVIIGMHQSDESPYKKHSFTEKELFWLEEIARQPTSNSILTVFAKPYILSEILSFDSLDAVVMGYQNSAVSQQVAAELLFGVFEAHGKLPVTAHPSFPAGSGLTTQLLNRLGYTFPERMGFDPERLSAVDTLMQIGLDSLMFPGAQVLIARHGQVVFQKAYGKPTYDSERAVTNTDLYDLASLTKILATLPMLMQMEETGMISFETTFGEMNPDYAETELRDVTVLKALSHYGRLPAWIAFYLDTLNKDRKPSPDFYRPNPADGFSVQVAERMYLSDAYNDSIYNRIGRQSLKSNQYRYSDVPYYVFKKFIEDSYDNSLDELTYTQYYHSLGANSTTYKPLERFPKSEIMPTEVDNYYRYQIVQGFVHDMGAAMQGGVGGHAGLFSNANDVAKIMQMYLQGGYYGGKRYLNSRTVEKFNKCYFCNQNVRRGVGFDKPQLEESGPTCGCVSSKSFGHSGFTGTFTWADPETGLVYVFLSNRTYPSSSNTMLIQSSLRSRIQQAIYDSLIN